MRKLIFLSFVFLVFLGLFCSCSKKDRDKIFRMDEDTDRRLKRDAPMLKEISRKAAEARETIEQLEPGHEVLKRKAEAERKLANAHPLQVEQYTRDLKNINNYAIHVAEDLLKKHGEN